MRKLSNINEIIVHCSDTRINQSFDISDIRDWHLERGWNDVGYHYYIKLDGTIQNGRSIDIVGAHVGGRNSRTIGICFEGGKDQYNEMWSGPTDKQIDSFKTIKNSICVTLGKDLPVNGHRKYSSYKTCPNFNVEILS